MSSDPGAGPTNGGAGPMSPDGRRGAVRRTLADTLRDPARIRAALDDRDALHAPAAIRAWLAGLALGCGVPFAYLVPDDRVLPPESIRHFRVDNTWITVLLDGAASIGRTLTTTTDTHGMARDAAVAEALRVTEPGAAIGGFLLRSRVVRDHPRIGVTAYPTVDGTGEPLPLIRLDILGPGSDTLLCLVSGVAARYDVHEPPEHLHFGIDTYQDDPPSAPAPPTATKSVRAFDRTPDGADPGAAQVHIHEDSRSVDLSGCFRETDRRTLRMAAVAAAVAATNAAELGFCMTEGVGMTSFVSVGPT